MEDIHHRLNYIELPATDVAAMKSFYSSAFGWSFTDYGPKYAAFHGAGLEGGFDGGAAEGVFDRKPSNQGALVILYSDDLEASLEAIGLAGGTISVPCFDFPGGRRFHFTDPSGNELGVWTKS